MISLRSKITQAVLGYLMMHENAELYVNEMARRLLLDDGNLSKKLKELQREGILNSQLKGKERYYSLNASYPLLNEYKRIILKTVGFEYVLKEVLEKIRGLEHAYLFGSYAQNKMDSASDIDLLVIGNHSTIELQKKMAEVQKSMDREINVISVSELEYEKKQKKDPLFRSIKEKKIQVI
ncbi:MAG: nucleotidyltransferase domain-containing protein [Chlamydiae bacterium]|nr:nucleotidyltransferase domain-containing protein [Chlamydiota bacterium]MBI3277365.1 nucleotidyltransferase domain-containing protein [Chlamydiota bacterium]